MIRKEWIVVLAVLMLLVAVCAAYAQEPAPYRIGVGLGIPYGVVGVNAEMNTDAKIVPTLGLGYAFGVGWFAGGRYYLNDRMEGKHEGPRFTLGYGVTTVLLNWDDTATSIAGLVFGFGTQGKNWNVDLMISPAATVPAGYTRQGGLGGVGLSFGYMFK